MMINAPIDGRDAYGGLSINLDDSYLKEIADNLVSEWSFDTGAFLIDTEDSNNLINVSSVTQSTTHIGGTHSAQFNGSNYFNVGNPNNLTAEQSYSISLWFNTPSLALLQVPISKDALGTSRNYNIFINTDGSINSTIGDGTTVAAIDINSPSTLVSINTWHHACLTHNLTTKIGKVYLDGIVRASGTYAFTVTNTTDSVLIGRLSGATPLSMPNNSFIDQVKFFNKDLTGPAVNLLFRNPEL